MILTESDAVYAADKFIDYYTQFNRIDDYLRFVKKDRIKGRVGSIFGADTEFFDAFDMHPNDMNFEIKVVDTDPKTSSRYNQWLYSETLNLTASNPIESFLFLTLMLISLWVSISYLLNLSDIIIWVVSCLHF